MRLKPLTLIIALVALAGSANADCLGIRSSVRPLAFETLTVSTTALGFTADTFAPTVSDAAVIAIVTVETNPARFRVDGLNPTSSVGHAVTDKDQIEVCGTEAIRAFRAIRSGASDSTFRVTYYR